MHGLAFAGFLVPTTLVGDSSHQIGISDAAWRQCFDCNALGSCIRLPYSNQIGDQLANFRSITLANLLMQADPSWRCSAVLGEQFTYSDDTVASQQTVACTRYPMPASFSMQLDCQALNIKVEPLAAMLPAVVRTTFVPLGSCSGRFIVEVFSKAGSTTEFTMVAGSCHNETSVLGNVRATDSLPVVIAPMASGRLISEVISSCDQSTRGFCNLELVWETKALALSLAFFVGFVPPTLEFSGPPIAPGNSPLIEVSFSVCFLGLDFSHFNSFSFDSVSFLERYVSNTCTLRHNDT